VRGVKSLFLTKIHWGEKPRAEDRRQMAEGKEQFGPLMLDTDKEEELCVPCLKIE